MLTVSDTLIAWEHNAKFREWFNSMLADCEFSAFRWETPSATIATLQRPFEFVLIDEPALSRAVDATTFSELFLSASASVVAIPNVSRDATLIVPCPVAESSAYGHLAAFVRNAPASQQQTLWQTVGKTLAQRIGTKPVWLSTAGAGVSWLHIRLDDQPKYYQFSPYRQTPEIGFWPTSHGVGQDDYHLLPS